MKNVSEIIIEPHKPLSRIGQELWQYRELFFFLAWRNILVRYKQTVIGVIWVLMKPLLTMVIFTVVFSKIANLPSQGIPYPLLVYAAMLPWQFFSSVLNESADSVIGDERLISKVYFPRIIIPTSTLITGFVDIAISTGLFLILLILFGFSFSWTIFFLPIFFLMLILLTLGLGYIVAALNVKYRDFRYVTPFIIQTGLYISPIGFSSLIIPNQWKLLYNLNPIVGIVEGFRWALLGGKYPLDLAGVAISVVIVVFIFILGFIFFIKSERQFADVI